MTKAKLIEEPIIGVFGEKVNVGDTVMMVTTGRSNVNVAKGVYKGYIVSPSSYYPIRARVETQDVQRVWFKPDGTKFKWSEYRASTWKDVEPTLTIKEIPYTRKHSLILNRIATLKD